MNENTKEQKVPPIEPGAGLSDTQKDPVKAVSDRLSSSANEPLKDAPVRSETPTPPQSLDISRLSPDQLYELKEQLDGLAPRSNRPVGRPTIRLRQYDGHFIVDFKPAFNTWQRDEKANQNVEMVMMPVKLLGQTDFVNIPWKEFMNAPQIQCEVISRRSENDDYVDGPPVRSRANGMLIERTVKRLKETFTVKLPAGTTPDQVELEARIVNA
jgi:hypothetical protein